MKKRILIGLGTVALAMGFGAGVAGFSVNQTAETLAASSKWSTYDVYFDAAGWNDYTYGADVYCHNWGASDTAWPGTKMTRIRDTLYGVKLNSTSNTGCCFDLGNGQPQTKDLTVNLHKAYLYGSDSWYDALFDAYNPTSQQSPSTNTFRVFINNSDVGGGGTTWNTDSDTAIRVTGSSDYSDFDGAIYDLKWFKNEGEGASENWYGYADIPVNTEKFQVIRVNKNAHRLIWNWGPQVTVSDGVAHGARVYRMTDRGGSDWSYRYGAFSATTSDPAVGPAMMTNILNAYTTCDMSVLNGVGAYTDLNSNFFAGATNDAKNTAVTTLGTGAASAKASVHIAAMLARQGGIPKAQIVNSGLSTNNSALIIGGLAFVGLAAAGTMIFVAKRRKDI